MMINEVVNIEYAIHVPRVPRLFCNDRLTRRVIPVAIMVAAVVEVLVKRKEIAMKVCGLHTHSH